MLDLLIYKVMWTTSAKQKQADFTTLAYINGMVWLNNRYTLEIELPLHVHFCIKAKISFNDMLTHPVSISFTQGT